MSTPLSKVTFRDSVVVGTTQATTVSAKDVHVESLAWDGAVVAIQPKAREGRAFGATLVPLSNVRQMFGVASVPTPVKDGKK